MTNKKTAAYCLLLIIFIVTGTLCVSIGEAQARYSNTIFCSTVLETAKTEIFSNILVKNTEAPVTVLLGKIQDEKIISFKAKSSGAETKEILNWSIDSEYISVEIETGGETVETGAEVIISAEEETEFLMKIIPSDRGHQALTAKINVSIGELCGTFELDLPAQEVAEGESPGYTEIPPEDGSGSEDTGESAGDSDLGNTAGESEGVLENPGTGIGELKTIPCFEPDGMLPIKMILPDETRYVKMGFYENGKVIPFPDGTRISVDEGGKFYTVYGGGMAEFDISKFLITDSGYSLLLDFENIAIEEKLEVTIAVEAYSAEAKIGTYTVSSTPTVLEAGKTEADFGVREFDLGGSSETDGTKEYYILSSGDSLLIEFPKEWIEKEESALRCSVQVLSIGGNETLVYNDAVFIEDSLWSSYTVDEKNCNLKIEIGNILPAAGTYQAYIRWEFDGICYYKQQITFFINYSTDIYSTFES